MKQKKVYIRWLFSYILLLLPPIVIGWILYLYTLQSNWEQAERLNKSLMTIVTNEFDYQIDRILQDLNRLALDTDVQILSNSKGKIEPQEQYYMYSLYSNLRGTNFTEEYIEDVFVYFKDTDWVVSTKGNMAFNLFYSLYGKNEDYTQEEMKQYLSKFHFRDCLPLTDRDDQYLLFTMNTLNSEVGDTSAVIGISLDISTLDHLFEEARWDEDIQLVVLDAHNQPISASDERFADVFWKKGSGDIEKGSMEIGGNLYLSTQVPAKNLGWDYVLFVPEVLYQENAREIQKMCLIGLFTSVVIGLFLSYYLCRVNYNPLKDLMERFQSHRQVEHVEENEFQWLSRQSEAIFSEYDSAKERLKDNVRQLKWYGLLMLLENTYDQQKMETDFSRFRIQKDAPYNVVVVFDTVTKKAYPDDTEAYLEENALYQFILTNVFEEKIMEYYLADLVDLGHQMAAIINIPVLDGAGSLMKELLEETIQYMEKIFGFQVRAFMGGINPGPEGIRESYLQALEAQEYAELLNTNLVFYDEIKNVQKKYTYSIDTEQKIMNAMKAGNVQTAYDTILQVLEQNNQMPVSTDMRRCLIFDLMGTLLKGAEEGGYYTFAEDFHFGKELSEMPLEQLKERFRFLIENACEKIRQIQRETEGDRKMSRRVEEFIKQNYEDPDLNISLLGQQFHITPAYLSAIYKKQTGNGLLDYMNEVRMEHAQEFLKQGKSVVEAAQLVGFRESSTFIRAFKKKTGMTPGQFKKILEKEEEIR